MKLLGLVFLNLSTVLLIFGQPTGSHYSEQQKQMAREWANVENHYKNIATSRSSSGSSTISGNYNSYGWADYGRMKRIQAAENRQAKRWKDWQDKEDKFERLIFERNIRKTGEYYDRLVAAALEAGFTQYDATRWFGNNAAELDQMNAKARAAITGYKGSTKPLCTGNCEETLTLSNGDIYVGNTVNGIPNGKGVYTGKQFSITGFFENGQPVGNTEIKYADGGVYKGGFSAGNLNGFGRYTYVNGNYDEGNFTDGMLDGPSTMSFTNGTLTGTYVKGKRSGKFVMLFKDGMKTTFDYDNPANSTIEWPTGETFKGILDENGSQLKGYFTNNKGFSFDGLYKNSVRYRGVYETTKIKFRGEFIEEKFFNYGMLVYKESRDTVIGFFGPGNSALGWRMQRYNDGTVEEHYYPAKQELSAIFIFFTNKEVFQGIANKDGYSYVGMMNSSGVLYPYVKTNTGKWEVIPAGNKELIANAAVYSKQAETEIKNGRIAYNVKMDEFNK